MLTWQDTDPIAEAINRLATAIENNGLGGGGAAAADPTPVTEPASEILGVPKDLGGLQALLADLQEELVAFLPSLGAALAILVVGWLASKLLSGLASKAMHRSKVDPTLSHFLEGCIYMTLVAFVIISAISALGVNTASFVAILGAASFAVGFALQGSLSNFAAGVMMMIFRHIRVGDLVEAGGIKGVVADVGVFATIINTLENKKAIVANSTITGSNIINYSANQRLRVDMTFGISYGDDLDLAIQTMMEVLKSDERVLADPAPTVACVGHGSSSVDFVCRPHVHPDDYWGVWFDTHKRVKEAFDEKGISIPFPQRDVHMIPHAG